MLLAGAINLAMASTNNTTEPPMVNYDSTDEPTTVDPPMVNFDDDGNDDDAVVIELPEDEDEDAAARAAMVETEAAMHERQLYKAYDDSEGNDNSTIEIEVPTPDDNEDQDRIVNGFFARNGWFPTLARIFPTFGRSQFV